MSEPFLAEIKLVGFSFAPRGYALCDGQILPISQNQSLYALLGTTYGGDGRVTFALPDLRGRTPVHSGPDNRLGLRSGAESHILTMSEMPAHNHQPRASSSDATTTDPAGNTWAANAAGTIYGSESPNASMAETSLSRSGGGQSHNNMQPYIVVNFVIALQGLFPPRN